MEISRIAAALRCRPRFAQKLFTAAERAYCLGQCREAAAFAARFAAKEAVAKALGQSLRWQEVEIGRGEAGRPRVQLRGQAKDLAGAGEVLLSLSHSRDYAVAMAVLLSCDPVPGGKR